MYRDPQMAFTTEDDECMDTKMQLKTPGSFKVCIPFILKGLGVRTADISIVVDWKVLAVIAACLQNFKAGRLELDSGRL